MTSRQRLLLYIAVGVLAGLLLAFGTLFVLTRSEWGMERARRFAVSWLEDRVHGELRIGRVTGPGLLRGVMLHDVEIVDPRGRPFLRVDSARLAYDWRTLLRGQVVLNRTTLYQPVVNLERLPGDDFWNYELVFPDTMPPPPDPRRNLILFQQSRIVNGTVALRRPWEPEPPVAPEDTARLILESVPGGLVVTWRFEDIDAQLGRVLWESPLEDGQLFEVRAIAMRGFVWKDPFLLRNARGTITRRDSLLTFDVPDLELPASRAAAIGSIIIAERDLYDVRIEGRRFLWRDLRWIYPPLPTEGGGSVVLHIQSQQPQGVLWHFSDARLAAPGTRLAGNFGIVAGDTLYFTDVDLRASPLNLDLIEQMLPGGLPVQGLLVGTVEISGPLSSLVTSGDLHFAGAAGSDGGGVSWRGTFDMRGEATGVSGLAADLRGVDLGLFAFLRPDLPLEGRVSGHVDLSGRMDRDLRFSADLRHALAGRTESRIQGAGTANRDRDGTRFDVSLRAEPVSIEQYLTGYPFLAELGAEIRGPVRVSGRADSLSFSAELGTRGGPLELSGLLRNGAGPPRYAAEGRFTGFRVNVLAPELPETRLSGSFSIDLSRAADSSWHGAVAADIDAGDVGALALRSARFRGELAGGLLLVDTLDASTDVATARGDGSFAIAPDHYGTLVFEATSDGLAPLESLLFAEPRPDPMSPSRVAGSGRGRAILRGGISGFDLDATILLDGVVYDDATAGALEIGIAATGMRSDAAGVRLDIRADTLLVLGHELARGVGSAELRDGQLRFGASAGEEERDVFRLDGHVLRDEGGTLVAFDELRIGDGTGAWALRRPAVVTLLPGSAIVDSLELVSVRGDGALSAGGRLAWRDGDPAAIEAADPLDFGLDFRGVPLEEFLRLARSGADASAAVDGRLRIGGTARSPVLEGEIELASPRIAEAMFEHAAATFRYANRRIVAALDASVGGRRVLHGEGTIPIDLAFTGDADRWLTEPLDVVFTAERLPAATVLGLLDGFTAIEGALDGTIALRGTTREPALEGSLRVSGGAALWDATGVRYRNVNGTVATLRDRIVQLDLVGRAHDPRVRGVAARVRAGDVAGIGRVAGTIDFAVPADPAFDLSVRADEALAARRRDADVTVTGNARLTGRYHEPVVSGSIRVDRGALHLDEIYRQYLIVDLEDPLLFDAIDTAQIALPDVPSNPFLRHLVVDNVRIGVGPGSWLRSRDMNVEVTGDVMVDLNRAREELRLSGSMHVLRGTWQLYYPPLVARRFDVQDGTIDFPGTPGIDPSLSITAVYRARSIHGDRLDITAHVSGTLEAPRVRLSSNAQPPISESDLASYLFFGAPTNALAPNAAGGSAPAFGELGLRTFGPSALGYLASGLQTIAQSTGFIDYVGLSAAESLPGQSGAGLGSVFSDAQLEIGLYLAPEMFVAFTKRLNSPNPDAGVRLEWHFHPTYTAEIFAEDRFARQPSFGLTQFAGEARKIFGFWVFREWGY